MLDEFGDKLLDEFAPATKFDGRVEPHIANLVRLNPDDWTFPFQERYRQHNATLEGRED